MDISSQDHCLAGNQVSPYCHVICFHNEAGRVCNTDLEGGQAPNWECDDSLEFQRQMLIREGGVFPAKVMELFGKGATLCESARVCAMMLSLEQQRGTLARLHVVCLVKSLFQMRTSGPQSRRQSLETRPHQCRKPRCLLWRSPEMCTCRCFCKALPGIVRPLFAVPSKLDSLDLTPCLKMECSMLMI